MVQLLVIADDFTGALDTGVQFHAENSLVFVYQDQPLYLRELLQKDLQVLIIDAETRHLKPEEAYRILHTITEAARETGVSYLYKKTDSGLRGNIGSELDAFLNASGAECVHFFPAFPKMGRTTEGGIHYIDGIPVAESVFGKDPFEPVRRSSLDEIIALQSSVKVILAGKEKMPEKAEGIVVYDSSSNQDMEELGWQLKEKGQLKAMAGCAGFASVLFRLLELETKTETEPEFVPGLLTICGSINSVTVHQLDYASERGVRRFALTPEQKLKLNSPNPEQKPNLKLPEQNRGDREPSPVSSKLNLKLPEQDAGIPDFEGWLNILGAGQDLIIECGVRDMEKTADLAEKEGLTQEDVRKRIADSMGCILKELLDLGMKNLFLITGGDTLLAFMQQIGVGTLEVMKEVSPGVVLSEVRYRNTGYYLLSKSGGFGQEDLMIQLSRELLRDKDR